MKICFIVLLQKNLILLLLGLSHKFTVFLKRLYKGICTKQLRSYTKLYCDIKFKPQYNVPYSLLV